jgi:hypothetical protein
VNLPGKHFSLVTIKKGPSLAVFLFDSNGLFVARPCKVETKMRQLQCLEGSLVVTLPDKELPALTEHTLGLEHWGSIQAEMLKAHHRVLTPLSVRKFLNDS